MQMGKSVCRRGSWKSREPSGIWYSVSCTNQRRGQKLSPLYVEKDFLCYRFATALNKCVAARRIGEPPARVPQAKQSTGLFGFPSCAFYGKGISRPAGRDQRHRLWNPPPFVKGGRKLLQNTFQSQLYRRSAARAFAFADFFGNTLFCTLLTKSCKKGRIPMP